MKRSVLSYLASCFILSSFLFDVMDACWGQEAPQYGVTTPDYSLLVGSDLVLNCSLFREDFADLNKKINSSDLIMVKDNQVLSKFIKVIDDLTIQLNIPNATVNHTGLYICKIFLSQGKDPVVCGSKVNVGYPPHPVKNFSCVSRNFNNLNCSWSVEENKVYTTYDIKTYLMNNMNMPIECPVETRKRSSCEWSTLSDPIFLPYSQDYTFTVFGNNSLGNNTDNFKINLLSIVIPDSPINLTVFNISEQAAAIRWKPPVMRNFAKAVSFLKYQVWLSKAFYDSPEVTEFETYDIAANNTNFLLENLIPHVTYNVSIRCKSIFAEKDDKWSNFTSVEFTTLADVPYRAPDVIPEAFEIHIFEHSRSATLYWKAVPQLFHNGEAFHYHIKYYHDSSGSEVHILKTNNSSITVKNLQKNLPYTFRIYSANEEGISEEYGSIFIDSQDKIPPAPREVRVISQDLGHYNMTWMPPNDIGVFTYTVFWCSSSTPWLFRCDNNSIHWTNGNLSDTNILLKTSNAKSNYQFAVASKSKMGSSSLEWASCILPHKGGLSKIKYVYVEQKSSTSLKVIWILDCPAEKAMLKSYEITYCEVEKNQKCHTVPVKPVADDFLLENLNPNTNYSIKIRAINSHNKSSEESDKVYQSTLPGAPSGPPQNIQVLSKNSDSVSLSWTPPLKPNGIITSYIVSYNNSKMTINVDGEHNSVTPECNGTTAENNTAISDCNSILHDHAPTIPKYSTKIDGLRPFSTYAVQIQACVNNDCSIKSEPIPIETEVDEPGYMEPPRIEEENSTHFKVSWAAPTMPNGPIDFYIIEWRPEKQNASSISNNTLKVYGATSVILDVKCPSLGDEGTKYLFYVRAVNKKNDKNLYGPLSKSTQAKACQMPERLGMFIGTIVGAAFGAIFVLIVIYRFALWMKLKIHQVKSITIRLPEGLEGPETNPLNNYNHFKNGLNGNIQIKNSERHSYIIDENKNRHGSGSSQFSNSSAEEVMYKNEKCAKFGRKPSGDSSGCSSMSSSITPRTHLSSGTDSGTECDFAIPPSPEITATEPILLNSHKPPLPILMEVHDQQSSEKNVQMTVSPEKQYQKRKNALDDIILKIDPPYSKFGYAGNANSSVLWRVNPLIFYNCNLANSEPSVFETKTEAKSETVFAPYSKVGLAKSSGDIGLPNNKQNGYSKFGYPSSEKRFSIPPTNLNPIAMVLLENSEKKLPIMNKLLKDKYPHHKINKDKQMPLSNNLTEDSGYIKVGKNKMCANTPSKGYVPFHEVRHQMDQNQLINTNNCDKVFNNYLNGNDQVDFPDDTEWPPYNNQEGESTNVGTPEILFDVPFPENSTDCVPPLDGNVFIANSYGSNPLQCQNSDDTLPKVPYNSDIKLKSDSPVLSLCEITFDNNSFLQPQTGSLPNSILNPTSPSVSAESHPSDTNNRSDCYGMPNEVIMTPVTLRNGYVPFHSLSDSMCDKTHSSSLPNNSKLTNPQNSSPFSACPEERSYKPSTHNVDNNFLQHSPLTKTVPSTSSGSADSLSDTQKPHENANGYANLSLNYILKPLPKMESEICEV